MSEPIPATAVIRAEPDGYDMAKVQLMGRQAAGHGFLRAAVNARGDQPIYGYAPNPQSLQGFQAIVRKIDRNASVDGISPDRLDRLGEIGVLFLADLTVATHAKLRQRVGLASFSLCGVTHTTASLGAMGEIADMLREAVMPWDALICTSTAVVETVRRIQDAEASYLRWRFGPQVSIVQPQLPLIPLGVHCEDFAYDAAARAKARAELGLGDDDVAGLFVGRLVFHAKAHPYPMFRAFQLAAERTGKRLTLILSGWFPNTAIEEAFRSGAAEFAPDVRLIVLDGRDPAARDRVWAGSDLFVSLSDNIQETFGLTPIEAMAAGLPVIVTDWNGYKDTVRHGVDGFRVRTWQPEAGLGVAFARAHEAHVLNYDGYCRAASTATAVDIAQVTDAVVQLATNPDLRRRMGEAGRNRAREVFDWPVVYRQHQDLWAELNARRQAAARDPGVSADIGRAPDASAARLDPFHTFGHYPTETIRPASRLVLAPGANAEALKAALDHGFFSGLTFPRERAEALFRMIAAGDVTLADAAARLGASVALTARAAALLMKLGLVAA